jgi:molecular chaperone DnaJ
MWRPAWVAGPAPFAHIVGPPLAKRDYYEVLIVSRTATQDEIKQAYRKLAKELHPDKNPGDAAAEDRFKELSEAFSVLNDVDKRRRYDRLGHAAASGDPGYERVDFRAVSEILEGLAEGLFGARNGRKRAGNDIEVELPVTFEEAALGAEKKLTIQRSITCVTCSGSGAAPGTTPERCAACQGSGEVRFQRGFFTASRPCQSCGGTGKKIATPCPTCQGKTAVPSSDEITVRVPPGVEDGAIRSVKGGGERSHSGGAAGDLHVRIAVQPHPLFRRVGADIRVTIPVSFPQAVLGTQVDVPTLEGRVKMKVPPGTPSGKVLRLRGRGIESLGGAGKGDQLVEIVVEIPEEITTKQRKLIEELAVELGESPGPEQKGFLQKLRDLFG